LDDKGNPEYFIVPKVAYDFIEVTRELLQLAAEADCICFGTLVQREEASRLSIASPARCGGRAVKFLDINLRQDCYFRETITESLSKANILKFEICRRRITWPICLKCRSDRCRSFARR